MSTLPGQAGLRVLVTALHADRTGGADIYTFRLAIELARTGYSVTVLCHSADVALDDSCTVLRIPTFTEPHTPLVWRFNYLRKVFHALREIKTVDTPDPALIIGGPDPISFAAARRWNRTPFINVPHSLIAPLEVAGYPSQSRIQCMVGTRTYDYLESRIMNRAVTTVRFTKMGCDMLSTHYGSRIPQRFTLIRPAVDLPEPVPDRSLQPVRLLFIGRLMPSKNVGLLLRCLRDSTDLPWKLDVVGDGPERAALEASASALGIAPRVVFHGHRNDVSPFYAAANLLAFPSKLESFGLVPLEAMAHGLPVLAIRNDGREYLNPFHEWFGEGTSFLADGEANFAERLRGLLRQPELLGPIGLAARRSLESRTWAHHARCYERLISQIVNTTTGSPSATEN